ncbi:MAG: hypothetical protein KBG84_09225 [Planctomycetes bacterium]|nr:hypothetical protein [Planctomycetota bacterium]
MLSFLLQTIPDGGAVEVPQEITVSSGEILVKFVLMALAAGGAALLPLLLRRARSHRARSFCQGVVFALMPAVVLGTGLATVVTGISLTRIKYGTLSEFWPLPLAIFALVLALELVGGILGAVAGGRAGEER